jgi:hypothetical protein
MYPDVVERFVHHIHIIVIVLNKPTIIQLHSPVWLRSHQSAQPMVRHTRVTIHAEIATFDCLNC